MSNKSKIIQTKEIIEDLPTEYCPICQRFYAPWDMVGGICTWCDYDEQLEVIPSITKQ